MSGCFHVIYRHISQSCHGVWLEHVAHDLLDSHDSHIRIGAGLGEWSIQRHLKLYTALSQHLNTDHPVQDFDLNIPFCSIDPPFPFSRRKEAPKTNEKRDTHSARPARYRTTPHASKSRVSHEMRRFHVPLSHTSVARMLHAVILKPQVSNPVLRVHVTHGEPCTSDEVVQHT